MPKPIPLAAPAGRVRIDPDHCKARHTRHDGRFARVPRHGREAQGGGGGMTERESERMVRRRSSADAQAQEGISVNCGEARRRRAGSLVRGAGPYESDTCAHPHRCTGVRVHGERIEAADPPLQIDEQCSACR